MTESQTEVQVREFVAGDEGIFRALNEEWITRYFTLEPKDEIMLADPRGMILDQGGRIFLALRRGEVVGCCALLPIGHGEFEVAKMAVTESHRGSGIGRQLLSGVITAARFSGATRLYLETNGKLAAAIQLYRSMGFRPLPGERFIRSPYARADVYMELHL